MHSAGPGHEDRNGPEIISCLELGSGAERGKICTDCLLCGLDYDKAIVRPYVLYKRRDRDITYHVIVEIQPV